MASIRELVELNNQGDLGIMLAKKFNGKIGHLDPRKDSDFMIGFITREATPSAKDIGKAVTEHYTRLGYEVEPDKYQRGHAFDAVVFFGIKGEGCVTMAITTFYPLTPGDANNHIRVTTNVIA